tara:strand:+ start:756 stop:1382 length:627 start_codon:yes stop_codon:yes gene_type:complete
MEEILTSEWGILLLILLRLVSIVIPIIPGTPYLLVSGYLFGFVNGLIISCISDLISCSICFTISKNYGRGIVQKLMPKKYFNKFESLSKNYLEKNFFLLTGFLMTGMFDFISYGVGLTKLKWKTFFSALFLSALLSDLPFVAAGDGIRKIQEQEFTLQQLLNLETVKQILKDIVYSNNNFWPIFIFSAILIFGIGITNAYLKVKYLKK